MAGADLPRSADQVVVPTGQQSWKGKSFAIAEEITGGFYYPKAGTTGGTGEHSVLPRPLKDDETDEFVLLDGTPATCANLGLFGQIFEHDFDLVISGPNLGRNSGAAFCLSSGTVGAAMSASIVGTPAIALSFGLMTGFKPPAQDLIDGALRHSCEVVRQLWELGFGEGADAVGVYSVNVPLMPEINKNGGPEVRWTTMARTAYGRLFLPIEQPEEEVDDGGPATIAEPTDETIRPKGESRIDPKAVQRTTPLRFKFAPDIGPLVDPSPASLVSGVPDDAPPRPSLTDWFCPTSNLARTPTHSTPVPSQSGEHLSSPA